MENLMTTLAWAILASIAVLIVYTLIKERPVSAFRKIMSNVDADAEEER